MRRYFYLNLLFNDATLGKKKKETANAQRQLKINTTFAGCTITLKSLSLKSSFLDPKAGCCLMKFWPADCISWIVYA